MKLVTLQININQSTLSLILYSLIVIIHIVINTIIKSRDSMTHPQISHSLLPHNYINNTSNSITKTTQRKY